MNTLWAVNFDLHIQITFHLIILTLPNINNKHHHDKL